MTHRLIIIAALSGMTAACSPGTGEAGGGDTSRDGLAEAEGEAIDSAVNRLDARQPSPGQEPAAILGRSIADRIDEERAALPDEPRQR